MIELLRRLNPAVPRRVLSILAGVAWGGVSIMLFVRAGSWLADTPEATATLAVAAGAAMGVFLVRRAFLPLVRKNLARLALRPDRACLFSMFAWSSWGIALVMSVGGVLLRNSAAPRPPLAAVYIGMGMCLGTGAFLYFRSLRGGGTSGNDASS
ncbi:hypothetical protein H8E07_08805 [bacterium]|nr:hypothetical protein [bacterium]